MLRGTTPQLTFNMPIDITNAAEVWQIDGATAVTNFTQRPTVTGIPWQHRMKCLPKLKLGLSHLKMEQQ